MTQSSITVIAPTLRRRTSSSVSQSNHGGGPPPDQGSSATTNPTKSARSDAPTSVPRRPSANRRRRHATPRPATPRRGSAGVRRRRRSRPRRRWRGYGVGSVESVQQVADCARVSGKVGGEHGDHGRRRRQQGQSRSERGHRPAAGRLLPSDQHPDGLTGRGPTRTLGSASAPPPAPGPAWVGRRPSGRFVHTAHAMSSTARGTTAAYPPTRHGSPPVTSSRRVRSGVGRAGWRDGTGH